ncbi:MAG: tetratricopeptide repeat protein, partial [Pyrinomonadaceae bacterium]
IDQAIRNASSGDAPALHYLKADIFQAEKNYPAAESELTAAIESDSNYLPAYSAYAGLLVGQNQIDRAIEQYRKIIEKRPSAPIYTLLGILEDSRGNYEKSEKHYRKALDISPDSAIAANNLAWNIASGGRGNLDEALRLAQINISKNLNDASFHDTLGWVYFKKGLNAQAVEQMKKAVAADMSDAARSGKPENPGYRLRLGQTLAAAGDKSGAKREVQVALQNQKDLSEREVQDARTLLSSL